MFEDDFERMFRRIRAFEKGIREYIESEFRRLLNEFKEDVSHIERVFSPMWNYEGYLRPLYIVKDRGSFYEIYIDLPKVDEGSIDIKFIDNVIYIRARLREEVMFSSWSGRGGETRFYEYREAIELPIKIDPNKVKVLTKRGMVKIIIYK